MARTVVLIGTCAALIVAWLLLWPTGYSDCAAPALAIVCPQASTVGLPLELTHSEGPAAAALGAISVLGASAFVFTVRRHHRGSRRD